MIETKISPKTHWKFIIRDSKGNLKSQTKFTPNLNTVEGGKWFLDTYYDTASNYTAAFYIGLAFDSVDPEFLDTASKITTGIPNPPTTNNWTEITGYSESTRPLWIPGSINENPDPNFLYEVDNFDNPAVFHMNSSGILGGGFFITESTKGGTSGILYAIDSGGAAQSFSLGDTISVLVLTGIFSGPQ